MNVLPIVIRLAGIYTLALGSVHFFLPALLDFRSALVEHEPVWKPPHPFRVWPTRYIVSVSDRLGVVWVSNHAASFILVSIGVVDVLATDGLTSGPGRWLALWIAGFWIVRAASQLYFGRRWGDWALLAWFTALGCLHLAAAIA